MGNVYFKAVDSYSNTEGISLAAKTLLAKLVHDEGIELEKFVPLKVTFGEKGNRTFIKPDNFTGVLEYLKEQDVESAYIETNVLYKGERTTNESHIRLAHEHGFNSLPIIIADGDHGENYENVEINKKNFKSCKIGKEIVNKKQIIVLSHFKGHLLAGFGGAIKQLAMGCASRGGKLAQHSNSIPNINSLKCKSCGACVRNCPENAIVMTRKAKIDKDKCVGCASCMTVCPSHAITHSFRASLTKNFFERLAEYAYAASKDKNNIYISFAFNITRGCDCEGHSMKPFVNDLGVFASSDPVAIDMACLDMLNKNNGRKVFRRGRHTLDYAEKIGLGSKDYKLVTVE